MAIFPASRYANAQLVRVPNRAGVYNLTVYRSVPPASMSFSLYAWRTGDRPDTVAERLLGQPELWWAIFDINPELVDPTNVPPGTLIRVPVGSIVSSTTALQ